MICASADGETLQVFVELWSTSLRQVILEVSDNKRKPFSTEEIKVVAINICSALEYLHNLPLKIIHRDIKSHNVLVSRTDEWQLTKAVLSDFSVSKQVIQGKLPKSDVGTPRWMAPEVHKRAFYDESADIWSFGMLLVELLTLNPPYPEVMLLDVKSHVVSNHLPNFPTSPSPEYAVWQSFVIERCLKYEPKERFTAKQCLEFIAKL